MIALDELKKLPIAERLQLAEDLWESIEKDEKADSESTELIEELRTRYAEFLLDRSVGVSWEDAKKRIRAGSA
jgi:putative addiction module component (TIGR02574 family)